MQNWGIYERRCYCLHCVFSFGFSRGVSSMNWPLAAVFIVLIGGVVSIARCMINAALELEIESQQTEFFNKD